VISQKIAYGPSDDFGVKALWYTIDKTFLVVSRHCNCSVSKLNATGYGEKVLASNQTEPIYHLTHQNNIVTLG